LTLSYSVFKYASSDKELLDSCISGRFFEEKEQFENEKYATRDSVVLDMHCKRAIDERTRMREGA